MKFLHTADWQIGMRAAQFGEKGERVRASRLESARRVVDLARAEKVDFLLLAGDVFEHNGVERLKIREVARILGAAPCPAYVIPGNHDPLIAGSVWEDKAWSEQPNVHILAEPAPVEIPGGLLYPCPVTASDSRDDPTAWIDARTDLIAVGMAHGSVENGAYGDVSLPIPRNAAEARGLDYLALGHHHSRKLYADPDGRVRMAYSGTHESTSFDETASGNALVVEISRRGAAPQVQVVRTGCLEWISRREAIDHPGRIAELAEEFERLPAPERTLVECTLSGTLFGTEDGALSRLIEIVEGRFLFGRINVSGLVPDEVGPDWIERLPEGYLREAAQKLLACARSEPPDAAAAAALRRFLRLWQEMPL
jgi:DNA repair exonuclease SbcCD nuclease subunit